MEKKNRFIANAPLVATVADPAGGRRQTLFAPQVQEA
jgi:hypothetical protein